MICHPVARQKLGEPPAQNTVSVEINLPAILGRQEAKGFFRLETCDPADWRSGVLLFSSIQLVHLALQLAGGPPERIVHRKDKVGLSRILIV